MEYSLPLDSSVLSHSKKKSSLKRESGLISKVQFDFGAALIASLFPPAKPKFLELNEPIFYLFWKAV
ncbi:hypothetical protein LEP1GSC043_3491 [Leptospira weilii str. Ecochallenge]|uniref:Uncharacterized protein n=1 Tax=Leptospira weilii str. Ecochallenge TaxID=1049986 RepID=N1UEG8_9LEPT|nr:hypothetical protein LEP1GSC043_3491 [Leptospira weilii str. Ecochallenge]